MHGPSAPETIEPTGRELASRPDGAGSARTGAHGLLKDARLLDCPTLGPDRLARFCEAAAAILGVGALGGPVSLHLGCLGVTQVVVDPDTVELHNLANQMWPAASVGKPKSIARAEQVRSLNPGAVVQPVVARIEDLGLAALARVQVLVTGLDGRAARLRVAEISNRLCIPWVEAAVDGSGRSLYGTVTLFVPRRPDAVCYACRHDTASLGAIAREQRGPGCPSWRRVGTAPTPPTLQSSALSGIVAGLQALAVMRVLFGEAEALAGRQLVIRADGVPSVRVLEMAANPRCLLGHEPLLPLRAVPGDRVADVMATAAVDLGAPVEALRFHGRTLVIDLACTRCGHVRDTVRLAEAFTDAEVRCGCGAEMRPHAASATVSGGDLARLPACTWSEMGVPFADVVTAVARGAEAHYVVN